MSERQGYWLIQALCPVPGEPKGFLAEERLGIVAAGLDAAVAEFRQRYPKARIWSVKRLGDVDVTQHVHEDSDCDGD